METAPFLPVREDFHPKRNQARQKLATLPKNRFKDLGSDVYFELKRRWPEFADEFQVSLLAELFSHIFPGVMLIATSFELHSHQRWKVRPVHTLKRRLTTSMTISLVDRMTKRLDSLDTRLSLPCLIATNPHLPHQTRFLPMIEVGLRCPQSTKTQLLHPIGLYLDLREDHRKWIVLLVFHLLSLKADSNL